MHDDEMISHPFSHFMVIIIRLEHIKALLIHYFVFMITATFLAFPVAIRDVLFQACNPSQEKLCIARYAIIEQ